MPARRVVVLLSLCIGCGGKPPQPPAPPPPEPRPIAHVDAPVTRAPAPDHGPELEPPPWKTVGVGQTISFATSALDQDLDETRVEVTQLPASAKFDPITQTITWTPTKADLPRGVFVLAWSQDGGREGVATWEIAVDPKPQPAPVAAPQSALVETVLAIRQPRRLEAVNQAWPLDRMLAAGARTFRWRLEPAERDKLAGEPDGKALYTQLLAALARTHDNPRLDPKAPAFDKAAFGDPKAWRVVAVRPRIDKAWAELRIIYQAVKAAEPVFVMFRIRPTVEPALAGERFENNRVLLGMVTRHLLASDKLAKDELAHGKAVAALVDELMRFDESTHVATKTEGGGSTVTAWRRAFVLGVWTEARMGGGSRRNADGSYRSGDGWAWSTLEPLPAGDGTTQAYVTVAIPGSWTQAVPDADDDRWGPKCAPRFDPDDPGHLAGYEGLCRKRQGLVELPADTGGKIASGQLDATNLYVEHKRRWSVEKLPLDDGRRDLGEDSGMTCAQCHTRNFGLHDPSDPAAIDPSKGTPKARNHPLPSVRFTMVPTGAWSPFMLELLRYQECAGKQQLDGTLGEAAARGLGCPLAK